MTDKRDELARQILEIIPPAMAKIRTVWRAQAETDLTVPQLRILASVFRGQNLIGDIAKHLGVSQPALSMLVETMINKGFLTKKKAAKDRRQSPLALTKKGKSVYLKSKKRTEHKLSEKLKNCDGGQIEGMIKGLEHLKCMFEDLT